MRVLPPAQLLARLEDRFRLLTGGSRTALPRHQTLRAAVDWSYDLLTDQERALFARLSVFAGGWTLEAAEAVGADPDGAGIAAAEVLDLLTRLVDKSLVVVEAQPDGTARYRLLETLRQYAAERLQASGEAPAVRDRHLDWCAALAARADAERHGPQLRAWLDRAETELDNLRAALDWSLAGGAAEAGLRLAAEMPGLWGLRGSRAEGQRWLEALLAAGAGAAPRVRARALLLAGSMHRFMGDLPRGRARHEEALRLYRDLGDNSGVAWTLGEMAGYGHSLAGIGTRAPVEERRAWTVEAVAAARRAGNSGALALALLAQGHAALDGGDLAAGGRAAGGEPGPLPVCGQPLGHGAGPGQPRRRRAAAGRCGAGRRAVRGAAGAQPAPPRPGGRRPPPWPAWRRWPGAAATAPGPRPCTGRA